MVTATYPPATESAAEEPTTRTALDALDEILSELKKGLAKLATLPIIKGEPTTLFDGRTYAGDSDSWADVRQFNAVHVEVLVDGTNPSATVAIIGSRASGGIYYPLPDPNSTKTITSNSSFDVVVGSHFVRARISSISGTNASFTVTVTPYRMPSQPNVDATTSLASITAAKLAKDAQTVTSITCTNANTDYPASAVIPAGTKYIVVWGANLFKVAVDEATSAAVGVAVPANSPQTFPIVFGAADGDSKVHAQSPTGGTVVYVGYLAD